MSRVRIGTCSGPADAALVRAMYSARGIGVVVGAENHSSMLGGLGGSFLSLDIWVDDEDAEEAALLLHDLRERGNSLDDDGEDDDDFDFVDDRTADPDGDSRGGVRAAAPARAIDVNAFAIARQGSSDLELNTLWYRIDRRRRTGMALLLGCCITFGTAHMFTRAWLRGIALGAIEVVGILQVAGGNRAGTLAIVGAVASDVIGAVWRVWASPTQALPEARLHRR